MKNRFDHANLIEFRALNSCVLDWICICIYSATRTTLQTLSKYSDIENTENSSMPMEARPLGPLGFGGDRSDSRHPLRTGASPSTGGRTARTGSCGRRAPAPPAAGARSRCSRGASRPAEYGIRSSEKSAPKELVLSLCCVLTRPVADHPDSCWC